MDTFPELVPRFYQTQLEEIAVARNTIIHLPTGSGKTYIAIQLIKRLRETLQKPWGEGGKRCFFLVNNVPLVNQQKKVIQMMCPVDGVGGYSSEDNVDYWDKTQWDIELSKYQVIVMTSQILHDMITHGYIKLEDINLIIFDECHHAVDDHPMRLVMKHFEQCPVDKQPRILGLTATLLNSNVKLSKVQETLRNLETTFHAAIATANDMGEVAVHSTNPLELAQYYRIETVPCDAAQEAINLLRELQRIVMSFTLPQAVTNPAVNLKPWQKDITTDPEKLLKEIKNGIESTIVIINDMGIYAGALGMLSLIVSCERSKRRAVSEEEELLYVITITHTIEARMVLLQAMENDTGYNKILKHSSQKILQLLNTLKEYNPANYSADGALLRVNHKRKALSCLIFTQQRLTSKVLYNLLKDVKTVNPAEFGFLKHDYVVRFNVNPFKRIREEFYAKKLSMQVLLKFKNGDLNCVISTSVLEEGIDVPQCTLVVRYDEPLEYRSYIQSKGRARSKDASFVILVDEAKKSKFLTKNLEFQKIEQYVHSLLHGNILERDAPTEEEIQENLYDSEDIPPYYTKNGCRLPATSAISLLSRYCNMLPHDTFTKIMPMWIQEKFNTHTEVKRLITIIMPISCPVKEPIKGLPLPNLKSAKRSAALNVCKRLHEVGELHADTLLPREYASVDFNAEEIKVCFPNWREEEFNEESDDARPGTKKRVRKHPKVYPKCLDGPKSWSFGHQVFYLHVIKLDTAFEEPKDPRERALYKLLRKKEGYGFLTLHPLPRLCTFPMFLSVGEVQTSLEVNYATVQLDLALFGLVKEFHFFIFDQVLEIAKKFLTFDGQVNSLYVVPVVDNNGYDIDWTVMQTYKEIRPVAEPSLKERMNLDVTRESYKESVVTPWYRGSILPDRYIVSNVLEYLTPESCFDGDFFETFEHYYSSKYNLQIVGRKDQPLLEVRNISTRMNCLLPRAATISAFTDKQRKQVSQAQGDDKPRGFSEIFIPEFCIKYDYPGVLWYKAVLLPSIMHRINMLLIADELRLEIAESIKSGQKRLLKGEEWKPIEVDLSVAVKSLLSNVEESIPATSIDRINNPIDDSIQKTPNIMSVKESVYQLQKKKINKQYPWDESQEPIDVERNLSTVTLMDIECYDAFVTAPLHAEARSPPHMCHASAASSAILPPPLKYVDKIDILTRIPSRGPELRDILAALTTINSHDTFNLERVETLGDAFLKFAATLYLFHKFPKLDEGQLTNIKGKFIGNRNLYYAGERINLGGRMKVEQFSPRRDFVVPSFFAPKEVTSFIEKHKIRPTFLIGMQFPLEEALSGTLSTESEAIIQQRCAEIDSTAQSEPDGKAQNAMQCYVRAQAVSDKSVADCVEALIGTYLMSGGIASAIGVLEYLKIILPEDNFMQFLHKKIDTVYTEKKATATEIDWLLNNCRPDVEKIINYKFKDPSLLLEALSHSSYIRNRHTNSYERLEFLGDAVLDFLITSHIFENGRNMTPGDLTDLRSALVNNVTIASYVVKLGLHKFLCSQINVSLENAIRTFVEHQEEREHEIVEDVLYLIDEEDCNIAQYIDVPKCLSDIFEALVGAIFLDTGGDLPQVWAVIYKIMYKEIDQFSMCIPKQPVRVLMEMIHHCPSFGEAIMTKTAIPKVMVPVTFTKDSKKHTAYGVGTNKSQAKRSAAKLALKILAV